MINCNFRAYFPFDIIDSTLLMEGIMKRTKEERLAAEEKEKKRKEQLNSNEVYKNRFKGKKK